MVVNIQKLKQEKQVLNTIHIYNFVKYILQCNQICKKKKRKRKSQRLLNIDLNNEGYFVCTGAGACICGEDHMFECRSLMLLFWVMNLSHQERPSSSCSYILILLIPSRQFSITIFTELCLSPYSKLISLPFHL